MTFFNGFQPENIIKIIIRNIGFQPLIAVSRKIPVGKIISPETDFPNGDFFIFLKNSS